MGGRWPARTIPSQCSAAARDGKEERGFCAKRPRRAGRSIDGVLAWFGCRKIAPSLPRPACGEGREGVFRHIPVGPEAISDVGGAVVNSPNCYAEVSGSAVAPEALLSHLRVLVVEDESLIALNLELILRHFGCDVVGLVSDVGNIVDAVKKYRPDGIFLDVNLRGRKVFDVLAEVMSFGVPCVLSSGYDDPTLFPEPFRNLPRIAKPFDEQALRRVCVEFGSLAQGRQTRRSEESRAPRRPGVSARPAIRLAHASDSVRNPRANGPGTARRTAAATHPSEASERGKSERSEILRDRNRDRLCQEDRKIRRVKSVYSRNPL